MAARQFENTPDSGYNEPLMATVVETAVEPIPPTNLNFLEKIAISMSWPVHFVYVCLTVVLSYFIIDWEIYWISPIQYCYY